MLQVYNTKPVLRDPGFRNGTFEGQTAVFQCIAKDLDSVVVRIGRDVLDFPLMYLQGMAPVMKGETVVVIRGDHQGEEYFVVSINDSECGLWPRKTPGRRKVTLTIPISQLCKVH